MRRSPESVAELGRVDTTAAPDAPLIERAARGDHDAFARLIEVRAARLLRIARVILSNEADAYEAAQETLIAAWSGLPSLREVDRFDAWLHRTLVNKCRDALRKRGRVREIDFGGAELEAPDVAEQRLTQDAVLAAFDRLSVDERHILALHHVDDLPVAEIAGLLGVPIGTVKSRLWTARRKLARALEAER
jgi:RNA polymerase sigma-70 factor (ECF subfamily)